ncbi:MAG: methylmalonyl-CoA epimerase [Cyclobacteriaceae bacterium]|nr:MAG: methylmalonyl-CoA epimerase [Cyclobacteriaceae bacterium]
MLKLEHLGFAVSNLEEANELYTRLLGSGPYKHESVPAEKVTTSFFKVGQVKLELLEATTEDSAIAGFIQKRGEGLHHVAFEVQDIFQESARLRKQGFEILYPEPRQGADNKLVNFVHPKSAGGVLIELCQEIQ